MTDPIRNLSELAALLEKATPAPWRENTFNHKHEIKADGNVIGFVRRLEDAQLAAFLVNNAALIAARLRSMEEALKPFAEVARLEELHGSTLGHRDIPDNQISAVDFQNERGHLLSIRGPEMGDFRKARAAISGEGQ